MNTCHIRVWVENERMEVDVVKIILNQKRPRSIGRRILQHRWWTKHVLVKQLGNRSTMLVETTISHMNLWLIWTFDHLSMFLNLFNQNIYIYIYFKSKYIIICIIYRVHLRCKLTYQTTEYVYFRECYFILTYFMNQTCCKCIFIKL